jgi:hypothetical protein
LMIKYRRDSFVTSFFTKKNDVVRVS